MDGSNWYEYVGNNPLGFVDPSGMQLKIVDEPQGNTEDYEGRSSTSATDRDWMKRNGVSAVIAIKGSTGAFYYSDNANFDGFNLFKFMIGKLEDRYLITYYTVPGVFSHELGHAVDYVRSPVTKRRDLNSCYSEIKAMEYENYFHRAMMQPTRDYYPRPY